MKVYNKLVRDKIPEIIRAAGETPITRVLNDMEFWDEGIAKLGEETQELRDAKTSEEKMSELVDLNALVKALAMRIGSISELERLTVQKEMERGGFDEQIFLERTE